MTSNGIGTICLFAATNVLDGTEIGQNMQRHSHQKIRLLNASRARSRRQDVHEIRGNYTVRQPPQARPPPSAARPPTRR
jgi:hypothetical protein